MKRYVYNLLNEEQIRWIIRAKQEGKLTNREIANLQGISVRRVQQLYSEYGKHGTLHEIRKAGRPRVPISEDERKTIIEFYEKYRIGASYIGTILRNAGIHVDNNKMHQVLKDAGFAMSEPWHRKKWVRYEREHSNSLWHVDWHEIKDPRWNGLWLIVYEDESSRFIVG